MLATPALPWTEDLTGATIRLSEPITAQAIIDGALSFNIIMKQGNMTLYEGALAYSSQGSSIIFISPIGPSSVNVLQIINFEDETQELHVDYIHNGPNDYRYTLMSITRAEPGE